MEQNIARIFRPRYRCTFRPRYRCTVLPKDYCSARRAAIELMKGRVVNHRRW